MALLLRLGLAIEVMETGEQACLAEFVSLEITREEAELLKEIGFVCKCICCIYICIEALTKGQPFGCFERTIRQRRSLGAY